VAGVGVYTGGGEYTGAESGGVAAAGGMPVVTPAVAVAGSSVNALVVSAFVPVMGGSVSPGP
jgi:hypothetical protein